MANEPAVTPTFFDKKFASRKFLMTVIVWGVGTLAWIYGFAAGVPVMDASQWISFTTWIVGLYLTGNVAESYVYKLKQ